MDVDDDIEFDFFEDEPETVEEPAPRVRLPRRPPARRAGSPPRGALPFARLLALVGFVVFLVLVFALAIESCAGASKHDAYASYMSDVDTIASQSASNGKALGGILTTSGISVAQIENRIDGLAQQEQQNLATAESLVPPGHLRDLNLHVVEALELRVDGLTGLAAAFQKTAKSKDIPAAAAVLAGEAQQLTASDVVWDDLFRTPATQELQRQAVSGVTVPESHFVANPTLMTAAGWQDALQRIRGASAGTVTGIHGTNIGTVTAQPGGQVLSSSNLTTVTAGSSLAFAVVVHDGGDSQEVQIPVTLTIDRPQQQGGPITKTQTIPVIDPGQDVTLTFGNLGQVPFATQTQVKVDVKAVRGETNLSNNSASYPVIFSLP